MIVNIASTHGVDGLLGYSEYGVSMAEIIQMSKMLTIEWVEHGIRENTINPTAVLIPSRETYLRGIMSHHP